MIVTLEQVKQYLGIDLLDTTFDDRVNMLIPLAEEDFLRIRNIPFKVDETGTIIYPLGSNVTACEMVGFKLAKTIRAFGSSYGKEVSSESIDSHSISYSGSTTNNSYPTSITSSIRSYINGA